MIRPWYHSRLLWLGLLGMMFLLWLWVDSMRFPSWLTIRDGSGPNVVEHSLTNSFAEIGLGRLEDPFLHHGQPMLETGRIAGSGIWGGDEAYCRFVFQWESWFRPWVTLGNSSLDPFAGPPDSHVAHWFLVLIYVVVWSGIMIAWQRWKRRRLRGDHEMIAPE